MKSIVSLALVGAAAFSAGIMCANGLSAATESKKAYLVANIFDVTDLAMLKKYQAVAPGINAKFGGHVLARGGAIQVDPAYKPPAGTMVLLQFPDLAHLTAWYNSPDYAKIKGLRENASKTHEFAVEGLPGDR